MNLPPPSPPIPSSSLLLENLLASLEVTAMKLGLDTIRYVLNVLDRPQESFPCVLVGGTNGKGSTSTFLAALLRSSGMKVGLFTSPHLQRWNERFRVDGKEISDPALSRWVERLESLRREDPKASPMTFFELCTALALGWFREEGVQVAVLEVGLGGRLDATNACHPILSLIGSIDRDHMAWLGSTVEAIAAEKAGIVRPDGECLTSAQGEGLRALEALLKERGASLERLGEEFFAREENGAVTFWSVEGEIPGLRLGMEGAHQVRNAALALRGYQRMVHLGVAPPMDPMAIRVSLGKVRVAGRLERFPTRPPVVLDGAHNPEGMGTLGRWLEGEGTRARPRILVLGVAADKEIPAMLSRLGGEVEGVVATAADHPRAERPHNLAREVRIQSPQILVEEVEGSAAALARARRLAGEGGVVVVAGSLFLVGEIREILEREGALPSGVGEG